MDRINSSLSPVDSSIKVLNKIGSSLFKVNDIDGVFKQTNRIYSSLTLTRLLERITITHTLLLTDNSDFLMSDGSKLNVQNPSE